MMNQLIPHTEAPEYLEEYAAQRVLEFVYFYYDIEDDSYVFWLADNTVKTVPYSVIAQDYR